LTKSQCILSTLANGSWLSTVTPFNSVFTRSNIRFNFHVFS
jgi:hypothetical protein